ncbi:hypothetical protein C2S52_023327 [Perilla frutescens var. hirtella]|nr:hypothetical protein C2S52_023327 [Perilla frutescens var. hirtella]
MGIQKLKWTAVEEEALKAGVVKHGAGKWKNILVDSEFRQILANRSNVDLKDKWRNMGGQSSGAIVMTPRAMPTATGALTPETHNSSSILLVTDGINDDKPPQSPEGVKKSQKYNEMILDALSSIKDRNGSEFVSILRFIEKKYEVPQNFRRLLSSKLRKLVAQGRVEKVQKRYRIKQASMGTKTPLPKQKVARSKPKGPKQKSRPSISTEMEDAAKIAANKIAEAENKSILAAEAVKESERLSQMAEEADAVVMLVKQLLEQWKDKPDNRNSKNSRAQVILSV